MEVAEMKEEGEGEMRFDARSSMTCLAITRYILASFPRRKSETREQQGILRQTPCAGHAFGLGTGPLPWLLWDRPVRVAVAPRKAIKTARNVTAGTQSAESDSQTPWDTSNTSYTNREYTDTAYKT